MAREQKGTKMDSHRVKPIPAIHRVKCTKFPPPQLNAKKLCYFLRNCKVDYTMRVSGFQHDGSFILHLCSVWVDHPKAEGQRGHMHLREGSLDQATVDKIEAATPGGLLDDYDFVIFEESPRARKLYQATS
ncbi:MAG TPA: hypothetical protein VNZ64_23370 [Candidatus Acidoferrum sp.]|nr:hypothetical protein [Candidatus Acidoferrum sp.]